MANILIHVPPVAAGATTPIPTKRIELATSAPVPPATATGAGASLRPVVVTGLDHLPWIDPVLANALLQELSAPMSKDELGDIPIALSTPVGINTVFQSAQDPSRSFYLPTLSIREDAAGLAVRFAPVPTSATWLLEVRLVEDPPWTQLRPIPQSLVPESVRAYLSYKTAYNTISGFDFQGVALETVAGRPGYHLTLPIDSISIRDDIFTAMTTPASACRIVVVRQRRVAIPLSDSQYQVVSPLVPCSVDFYFPYEAHHGPDDIYSFIPSVVDSHASPRTRQVPYAGAPYVYFQDPVEPTLFYYLPDSFKLCRRPSAPHFPCLSIAFEGDTLETAQVTASYVALAVVDHARLEAAAVAPELATWAGGPIRLEPLPAQNPVLSLRLPGEDQSGPYPPRAQAHVNVATGIQDAITKPMVAFQELFAALFDEVSALFKGFVTVSIGDFSYEIPFTARIADLVGPVFEQSTTLRDPNTIRLTLRNAIEGSIRLLAPPTASVQAGGWVVAGQLRDAPAAFPLVLKAADQLQLTVAVGAPLTEGHYDVLVETQHSVESTGEAVLAAVLDPHVQAQFARRVAVKVPAGVFSARAAASGPQLVAIEVAFEPAPARASKPPPRRRPSRCSCAP